jgi:para-aminobenzoate synthetase component 1
MTADTLDRILARSAPLTGVRVQSLALEKDFVDLAARFAHLPGTVVLLSGGDLDCSRYHLLGALPWLTLSGRSQAATLTIDDQALTLQADPLTVLRSILEHFRLQPGDASPPMVAGLMGYLAYDLKDTLETLPRTSVDDLHLPALLLYAPGLLVVHDKLDNTTRLMVPERAGGRASPDEMIDRFNELTSAPAQPPAPFGADGDRLQSNFSQAEYLAAVQQVIDYIAAGDAYQVNLSQRFQVPFNGDGFSLFRHLFVQNPAPFFAFVQGGDHQIVSTSPERFLLRAGDRVETRPSKGTRPRGRTPARDQALRDELAGSSKDDAELSMIVDLLRNDIGKVCSAGSVRVAEHKRLEAYRNVYHLVSVVAGRLDRGKDTVDLIRAAFPGGSITGCPKVRAMQIIDELESCRRHVYCGSIGYIGFDDTMDLSIAIRTATIVNGAMFFSVGGGIVYDSRPQDEYEETLHKGHTLMAACRGGNYRRPASTLWQNGRLRATDEAAVPVTDQGLLYGHGCFETLRVDNGRAPLLADHLARLAKTWQALMPDPAPDLSWKDIIAQVIEANGLQQGCAAVKILATRGSRTQAPWDHTLLVSARPYIHRLKTIQADGLSLGSYPHRRQSPLAEHKTLNYLYYLQAGQWAQANRHHEALILNPDGTVSETNTASLLLINGREVIRPKSTAVLPGVMVQAVCRQLMAWDYRILERPVQPGELLTARQVLATNALMGTVAVLNIDDQARPAGDDLWVRLNDALIPGWQLSFNTDDQGHHMQLA